MKSYQFVIIILIILSACQHKNRQITNTETVSYKTVDTIYYRNLNTNKMIKDSAMQSFVDSLKNAYTDSNIENSSVTIFINDVIKKKDSLIRCFTYDVRVGLKYPVRSREYPKIGMSVPEREFTTIDGEYIKIGGMQDKPTVINLWFIRCGGCVAEIPALNRLYKKYKTKINFIALTFDDEKEVRNFLQKQAFNYKHIASKNREDKKLNVEPFINTIESYPYPENIFIDRFGTIQYVEGGLGNMDNLDLAIKHFELIIQDLLTDKTDDANSLIEEK